MIKIFKFIPVLLLIIALNGCSQKQVQLYNLTPDEWFAQVISDIKNRDLEAADKHYISMSSEHVASPMLEQTLIILAQAHADQEEYLLANFYLDDYIKRYGDNGEKTQYAQFLKIKSNFDSFELPDRNQKLMQNTIVQVEKFLEQYPNTKFKPLIETMLVKFKLGLFALNESIVDLYRRTGKDASAEIYQKKLEESPLKNAKLIDAKVPWYKKIFK